MRYRDEIGNHASASVVPGAAETCHRLDGLVRSLSALPLIFLLFTGGVEAEYGLVRPIGDAELTNLDAGLATSVRTIREQGPTPADECLADIYAVLDQEGLPKAVRDQLIFRAAGVEPNKDLAVTLLESTLTLEGESYHLRVREWIIDIMSMDGGGFGSAVQRIGRLNRLVEPLVQTSPENYDLETIRLMTHYARLIREWGYDAAWEIHAASVSRLDPVTHRRVLRDRLYHAEQAERMLDEFHGIVRSRIAGRTRADFIGPDGNSAVDNPLFNLRAAIEHELARSDAAIQSLQRQIERAESRGNALAGNH